LVCRALPNKCDRREGRAEPLPIAEAGVELLLLLEVL